METHKYRGIDKKGNSPPHTPTPPPHHHPKHKHTPVAMMTTHRIIDRGGRLYITAYRENIISEQIAAATLCCNTYSSSPPTSSSSPNQSGSAPVFFKRVCSTNSACVTFQEQTGIHQMRLLYIEVSAGLLHSVLTNVFIFIFSPHLIPFMFIFFRT